MEIYKSFAKFSDAVKERKENEITMCIQKDHRYVNIDIKDIGDFSEEENTIKCSTCDTFNQRLIIDDEKGSLYCANCKKEYNIKNKSHI